MTPVTFCGRTFTTAELELLVNLARDYAALGVTEMARTACEWLDWKRPNGKLKNHECRQLLEKLQEDGVLRLPAIRALGGRGPRTTGRSELGEPQAMVEGSVSDLSGLELALVEGEQEGRLWREYLERYHYLSYRVPMGASLRYWARSQGNVLGCLLWTSPAWKMAARDSWIGWSADERQQNLQRIVNNGRFLILPWVRVKGLASHLLARSARQLPRDWERRYGYRPVLLETLVDCQRFSGTCYRAANWIDLGRTTGRGRMDRDHANHGASVKEIFVYPLCRNVQSSLRRGSDLN